MHGYYIDCDDKTDDVYLTRAFPQNIENAQKAIDPNYENTHPGYKTYYIDEDVPPAEGASNFIFPSDNDTYIYESPRSDIPQVRTTKPKVEKKKKRITVYDEDNYALPYSSSSSSSHIPYEVDNETSKNNRCAVCKNYSTKEKCFFLTVICVLVASGTALGIVMSLRTKGAFKDARSQNPTSPKRPLLNETARSTESSIETSAIGNR